MSYSNAYCEEAKEFGSTKITHDVEFYFPHGIELEIGIVKRNGDWISEEDFIDKFKQIIKDASIFIGNAISNAPLQIKQKIVKTGLHHQERKGLAFSISYKLPDKGKIKIKDVDLISRDPHISRTFIIELSTPPCTSVEELRWWLQTLIHAAINAVEKNTPYILIPCGLNPAKSYSIGLSFGEHHHIGCEEQYLRLAIYNMIRNYVPHLIAISVNSPFENGTTSDPLIKIRDRQVIAPRCIRSIRLLKNIAQLGPDSPFYYLPPLTKPDVEYFMEKVQRRKEQGRLVDVYPFTIHETVEVRFFDTQFSIARQIAIAIILDSLAEKARKIYYERGINGIPKINSKTIVKNREEAVKLGLKGTFYPDDTIFLQWPEFSDVYNKKVFEGSLEENRYLNDAVIGMLYYIKDELKSKELITSEYIRAILVSIFGGKKWQSMVSPADFLLYRYVLSEKSIENILLELHNLLKKVTMIPTYDPLEDTPNIPEFLAPEKYISVEIQAPEMVYTNQKFQYKIIAENRSKQILRNIVLATIIKCNNEEINKTSRVIPILPPSRKIKVFSDDFKPANCENITIRCALLINRSVIRAEKNISVKKINLRISTDVFGLDVDTPLPFSIEIFSDEEFPKKITVDVSIVLPRLNLILSKISKTVTNISGSKIYLDENDFQPLVVDKIPQKIRDVESVYLQAILKNESNEIIGTARSNILTLTTRKMKIEFERFSEETPIVRPIKDKYVPGDRLIIQFAAIPDPKRNVDAEIKINFITEKSGKMTIFSRNIQCIKEKRFSFEWTIPQDLLITDIDYFKLEFIATQDGEQIGFFETKSYQIGPAEVPVKIKFIEGPRIVRRGESIKFNIGIERTDFEGEYECIIKLITSQKEVILNKIKLDSKKDLVLETDKVIVSSTIMIGDVIRVVAEIRDTKSNTLVDRYERLIEVIKLSGYVIELKKPNTLSVGKKEKLVFFVDGENIKNLYLRVTIAIKKLNFIETKEIPLKPNRHLYAIETQLPLSAIYEEYTITKAEILDKEKSIILKTQLFKIEVDKTIKIDMILDSKLDDGEPIPDFLLAPCKIIIKPIIKSKQTASNLSVVIFIMENDEIVSTRTYKNIELKANEKIGLDSIIYEPPVDNQVRKIKINGKIYQNNFEIPANTEPIVFFTIKEA